MPDAEPTMSAAEFAAVWAENQITTLMDHLPDHGAPPEYGSRAWALLQPGDPLKPAAALVAAEAWRQHQHEQRRLDALMDSDPQEWFRQVTAEADRHAARLGRALASTPTHAELIERRRPREPHTVVATPGWPPVAIPGRPGWFRHCVDGHQVDLPHADDQPDPSAEGRAAA